MKNLLDCILFSQLKFWKTVGEMLWDWFDDMPVMSHEAQRIFSVSEDRKLYCDAVDRLMNGSTEETITLSTGNTITLV